MNRHRYLYFAYLIIFVIAALYLNSVYNFTTGKQNTLSYIANLSELLGLSIALTEIFVLNNVTQRIRTSIQSLQSYSDISNVSIFLSQTKDDLVSKKFGKAVLRLEQIRDVYQENLPTDELSNLTSSHRTNFDSLNSIITALSLADETFPRNISQTDLESYVKFLTSFNETLTSLKLTFKTSII
jgi:hypothetical protein